MKKRHYSLVTASGVAQAGLQELTPDISKLGNLKLLNLASNLELEYIPESISCLQNLTTLIIEDTSITAVPFGLATLRKLDGLCLKSWTGVHFPPSLKVSEPTWPRAAPLICTLLYTADCSLICTLLNLYIAVFTRMSLYVA
jgi:hypothetical protein